MIPLVSQPINNIIHNNEQTIHKRRSIRRRLQRRASSSTFITITLTTTLLLLSTLPYQRVNAGLSIGGVTSTDSCYDALQNSQLSPTDNRVDQDGYVTFINELSNNAFTAFQYNAELDEWGMFPITTFDQLPKSIQEEFWTHSCGGPTTICENAYLYTDGTGDSDVTPSPQQEIYLFQVCKGVEDVIDVELDKLKPVTTPSPIPPSVTVPVFPTYAPTTSHPPTPSPLTPTTSPIQTFSGTEIVPLIYRALVTEQITSDQLNTPNDIVRDQLLTTMTAWSFMVGEAYDSSSSTGAASPSVERRRRKLLEVKRELSIAEKERRKLSVRPLPLVTQQDSNVMIVIDIDCNPQEIPIPLQSTDHCIQISTNLTLQFENEPLNSKDEATLYFETEFNNDIEDGTYQLLIVPPETQDQFRHLYLPPPGEEESGGGGSDNGSSGGDDVTPSPVPFDPTRLIDQAESDNNTDGGGSTPIAGIVSGVCVGIVAIGIGLFVYKKRYYYDDDDWSSKDSGSKKEFDPENDLEGGNLSGRSGSEYSSRDEFSSSGHSQSSSSMQSYSDSESRSSRSTDTGSYSSKSYTTGSSFTSSKTGTEDGAGGPASVSASESDSYSSAAAEKNTPTPFQKDENLDENRNRATAATAATAATMAATSEIDSHSTSTRGSRSSRGSKSSKSTSASDPYRANVDLMDQDISKGSKASSKGSKSSRATPTDDDSSAGSSGWDSSDGDSSVDTGSVDSYDPNTIRTGDLDSSKASSYPSSSSSEISPYDQLDNRVNPAVNPVVQHGVTMLPIEEAEEEDSTMRSSAGSVSTGKSGSQTEKSPLGGDIQEAIEKGDWAAVGATAAILASSDSSVVSSVDENAGSSSILSSHASTMDDDDIRAAEIDQLVETGNWDGVVAVAARYADEADEADDQLERPLRHAVEGGGASSAVTDSMVSKTSSAETVGSVSVESPGDDETSVFSNTTRDSMSHTTYSAGESRADSGEDSVGVSTRSGSTPSDPTPPDETTHSSSITSSYVSGNITSSMVSAASSVDQQEKRQLNAYRAEVEALVRRVVPDEIDNVDDIMVQFSGREEELIETLRAMQEKSIAQRARAAVQRSAKKEAGRTGSRIEDSSAESMTTDGQSRSSASRSSQSQSYSGGDSITEQFTEADDYSTRSGTSHGSYSSYSRSGSEYSGSQTGTRLSAAKDAGEWGAAGKTAKKMQPGGTSVGESAQSTKSPQMDELINSGDWSGVLDKAEQSHGGNADDLD